MAYRYHVPQTPFRMNWSATEPYPPLDQLNDPRLLGWPYSYTVHELEEYRKEEEFRAWCSKMARTPGTPRAVPPPTPPPETVFIFAQLRRDYATVARGVKAFWGAARDDVAARYRRAAFMCERKYWLSLTAYRQSIYPHLLRMIRNFVFFTLVLALALWLGKMKVDEIRARPTPQVYYYTHAPRHAAFSVAEPRCDCNCDCAGAGANGSDRLG
ncbi:hypothetical protein M426DRAFT_10747 [Hypoxylon sp. CI-4A]|nr:hypothetical protein M426DRAFT_10747 [Hypoxylon sp. CI-4A]